MVDLQSKYRLYSTGFTAPQPRTPTPTLRELYHEQGRRLFYNRKDRPVVSVHDCRAEVMKNNTMPEDWDAWLLSHGLRSTYTDCVVSHEKRSNLHTPPEQKPAKLLLQIGMKGSEPGDFNYPRGLCHTESGDIVVADSYNNRVQVFNRAGLLKLTFGRQGADQGSFNEPTAVVELPSGHLAVADRRNQRVQIFTKNGKFVDQFWPSHPPYSLACDRQGHLVVCTTGRTLEVYRDGHLLSSFPIPLVTSNVNPGGNSSLHVAITKEKEILVSDPGDQCIKVFGLDGVVRRHFMPPTHRKGLVCCPGGIFVTISGQVLVVDLLNHSVSQCTPKGTFLRRVLVPTDDLGCVHSLSVGPEGHLVVSEFSVTGDHCVKIFRHHDCDCHRGRRGTRRKRAPASTAVPLSRRSTLTF